MVFREWMRPLVERHGNLSKLTWQLSLTVGHHVQLSMVQNWSTGKGYPGAHLVEGLAKLADEDPVVLYRMIMVEKAEKDRLRRRSTHPGG